MKTPKPSPSVDYIGVARVVARHCGGPVPDHSIETLAGVFSFVHRRNGESALKACVLDCIDAGMREGRFPAYVSVRQ